MYFLRNVCNESDTTNILKQLPVLDIITACVEFLWKYTNCHVMAHGDEEVGLILSSRIEWEYQAVKKWPLGRNVGHTGDQMFALKWPQVAGHRKEKGREAKWLAGTPKRKWGSLPLRSKKEVFWARLVADGP